MADEDTRYYNNKLAQQMRYSEEIKMKGLFSLNQVSYDISAVPKT